jgi:hypothetical protein
MGKPSFKLQLRWADEMLERLLRGVGTKDVPWYKKRAREGIERARAELARTRDDIYWPDSSLPF